MLESKLTFAILLAILSKVSGEFSFQESYFHVLFDTSLFSKLPMLANVSFDSRLLTYQTRIQCVFAIAVLWRRRPERTQFANDVRQIDLSPNPINSQNFFLPNLHKIKSNNSLKNLCFKDNFLRYRSFSFNVNSTKNVLTIAGYEPGPENERIKRKRPNVFGFVRLFSFLFVCTYE